MFLQRFNRFALVVTAIVLLELNRISLGAVKATESGSTRNEVKERRQTFRDGASQDNHDHRQFEKDLILGENEAKDYYHLSNEEKARRLRALSERMDVDKDGFVDEHELSRWITNNHWQFLNRRTADYFTETDGNGDGKISFQEYEKSQYEGENLPLSYKNTKLYKHEQRRFKYADMDKDDGLTLREFIYFLHPEEGIHMLDSIVLETVDNIDRDADKLISLKDYIGEGILDMKNGEQFVDKVKEFKEKDKNLDGKLDMDEMRGWIGQVYRSTASTEAEHILNNGDKNKDGKLSYEELVAMRERLETSKVTQYGEILKKALPRDEL